MTEITANYDKMMTLPPVLQLNFKTKVNQYEEELKMPFLSTLEEMALEQGLEQGTKETSKKHILLALENRFGKISNTFIKTLNQIEDSSLLDSLFVPSLTVNSLEEFQQLISDNQ